MPTPRETREALQLLTGEAVATTLELLRRVKGTPEARRAALLDGVPEVVGYYAIGSAALAADFYEEERETAAVKSRYTAEAVVADRTVKLRRAIAWSAKPMFGDNPEDAAGRLAEVVQLDTARPFRDTVLTNRSKDPEAAGWRRIASGSGCKLCQMLASRGAVYKHDTATFATHPNCTCTAQPVFGKDDFGEEASVMQYVASSRSRTPAQQKKLRDYLNTYYGDFRG